MVKKLFKYEISFYAKRLLPFYIILFVVAAFSRFLEIFENNTVVYNIIYGSSIFAYVVAGISSIVSVLVLAVSRYYKNLYTAEGYLSFTLPVTPTQHIFVKTATALLFDLFSIVAFALSFLIISIGDLGVEVFRAIAYLADKYFDKLGVHGVFYIPEVLLLLLVASIFSLFIFYSCVTIGQLAKKNRVAASVGVYFGFYLIEQIIGTVMIIVVAIVSEYDWWDRFVSKILRGIKVYLHIGFIGYTLILAAVAVALFFINRHIMTKKLNLE